jgi:hypothetical protein
MTNIIIGVIVLLLSANFIFDTYTPCPVKWFSDLRNHEERMDRCVLKSRNRFMGWELKEE